MKTLRHRLVVGFLAVTLVSLSAGVARAAMPDPGPGAEGGMDRCCSLPGSDPVAPSAPTEAIAFGDFNGDGHRDVVLGMPGYEVDGLENAGAVRVLFGSSDGLVLDHPTVLYEGLLDQNGLPFTEPEAGDRFGESLAVGDLNGDGYDDLAIGSPGEDPYGLEDAGRVDIMYGSPDGPTQHGVLFGGAPAKANFGTAVTIGDFDGDGRDDLAVGSPGEGSVDEGFSGRVLLIQSQSSTWSFLDGPSMGDGTRSGFGTVLAVGDFDGDGYDDLVVGAPRDEIGASYELIAGGTVWVYDGSGGGLTDERYKRFNQHGTDGGCWNLWREVWHCEVKGRLEEDDRFGASLAVGDFDGDGYADLAVGVPGEDQVVLEQVIDNPWPFPDTVIEHDAPDAGAVNVVFGSADGLTAARNEAWHQDNGRDHTDMPDAAEAGDGFGATLAAGDFNGDGRDELAVGVPFEEVAGTFRAGLVHVLLWSSAHGRLMAWPGGRVWTHLQVGDPIRVQDWFSDALGAGDVDGDGKAELAIAAPVHAEVGGAVTHVLRGTDHYYGPGWIGWQSWYEAAGALEAGD